jgi:hypothetical protein
VCDWRLLGYVSVVEGMSGIEALPAVGRSRGCKALVDALVSDIAMREEKRGAIVPPALCRSLARATVAQSHEHGSH